MEEKSKVEPPVEPTHDELVNYISEKHYGGKDKEALSKKLTSDKALFDKALREIHQDHFADKEFEQFKNEYHNQYGNPFPEKKNSIQNPETPQTTSSQGSGIGVQNPSFLNQALNRIPKSSSDSESKASFDINALKKSLEKIPENENEAEANKRITNENELAKQENLSIQQLAENADKSGESTFKDAKGKDHSIDQVLEEDNTLDAFEKNFHNGLINTMEAPAVLAKSVADISGGNLNSVLLADDIKEMEGSKMYSTRESNKNIIDNPSDPRSYAAIAGQLTAVATTSLLTAGVGNLANVSSKGALALQGLNSLSATVAPVYISAKDAGLSDNGAAAMTLITSPVIAALDMVGLSKLLNNNATRSLVTRTGLEAIQQATENFTKKFTPEIAKKASALLASKTPDIIKRITSTSTVEGATEGLQETVAVGSEALYNQYFKDKDENGYNMEGWQKRILNSVLSGVVGGVVPGAIPNTPSPQIQEMNRAKDALMNDLHKENLTTAAKQIIDEQIKTVDSQIQEQSKVEEQVKAQEKARQEQTAALETQKAELESNLAIEDISPETKSIIENKVKDIDSQIQEINPTVESLNSKRAEILAGLDIDKKSGEPIITPEAQKQLDEIDNQIVNLKEITPKNENVTKQTVEPATEEKAKTEAPAVQEGQQLEEKLVNGDIKPVVQEQEIIDSKNTAKKQTSEKRIAKEDKQRVLSNERRTPSSMARGWLLEGGKLRSFQKDEHKISNSSIGKGIKEETGVGGKEISGLIGVFDNKNGLSVSEASHKIWNSLDDSLKEKYTDQDIRNALIDVVLSENRQDWVNNQKKETESDIDSYDDYLYSQLSDKEREEYDNWHQNEAYAAAEDVDALAKEYDEYLNSNEYKNYKDEQSRKSEPDASNQEEAGIVSETQAKQKGNLQSVRDKARDARNSQDPEKAREVVADIDNILMREGIISGDDASFADPTGKTFFEFLDQNKSVYRYHPDFKLAEGPFDLIDIAKHVPEKFREEASKLDFSNGVMFDDAFNLGFVETAKKLGYDGIRMMEVDGTDSTIQVFNFDKLDHIDGPDLRNKQKENATQNRKQPGGNELEHQGVDGLGKVTETSSSNINEQSREKQEEGKDKGSSQEIIPPPETPKKEGKSKSPKKVMKVAQRILDSEMVSDEVKEGLIKKGIHYIPQSNEVTAADAKAIIENHGKEKAYDMVMNTSNEMKDLGRGAVARQLFETYSNDAKTAETEVERKENLDKAVEIASFAAKMFKDAGQTVQSAKMWKRMLQKTPEGMLIAIEKDYSNQREEAISAIKKELKEDKKAIDEFINDNIDKILESDTVKKAIEKIIASKKGKARTKKDISDFFDGLKIKDDSGQIFEATYYVVKNAYNTAIEIIKKAVLAGVDIKDAVQKGIDSINSHPDQKGTWQEDKFRVEMTERISSMVEPKKDFSDISTSAEQIKKIVKDHYSKGVNTNEGLSEKLIKELGLSSEDAGLIAGKIQEEFSKAIKNQKSELLKKVSKAAGLNEKRKENLIKNIVKEIDLGTLDNQKFNDLYAESIGVATLTPEQKAHILKLAGTVKAAEDFVDKYKTEFTPANRKQYEKLKFEASKAFDELSDLHGKKKDIWDTMATMMQGNLMTPLSIVTNIYSNAVMGPLRFTTKGITSALDFLVSQAGKTKLGYKYFDPKRTTDFLATQKGYAEGFYKGVVIGAKQLYHGVPSEDLANRELEAGFRPIRAWSKVAHDIKTKNITNKTISDFTYAIFGTAPEATFRALNFGDKPFSKAAFEAKAREIGTLAGLKGEALEKFIEFPDEPSLEKIKKAGERATFQQNEGVNKWIQESLSKLLNEIGKMPLVGKPAKLLAKSQMPFVKTPLNIISETIDYAVPPFSLMKGIYHLNKGDREFGLTFISKAMVGTMIAIVARQLFENGLLSPSSDDNEKVRAMQFEEMPPEGLNISGFLRMITGGSPKTQKSDIWINYKKMGPIGIIFNTHANRLNDKNGSNDENKAITYVYDMFSSLPGIASASLEQSFLQGTNNLLTAIQEGGYKLDKWMINTTMTMSNIAMPNTISTASRATNDYMPDLRGDNFSDQFVNTLKSRYFMAGQLPPKVTMWGEPVKQTPEGRNRFIYHFLDPTKNKELRNNEWSYKVYELWKKTEDKEALPAVSDRSITIKKESKKLTPDQYNNYASFVGKARARLVKAIVESDSWEKMDDEKKIKFLKKAYESGAKIGKNQFKKFNK